MLVLEAVTGVTCPPTTRLSSCQALFDVPSSPEDAGVDQLAAGVWETVWAESDGCDFVLGKKKRPPMDCRHTGFCVVVHVVCFSSSPLVLCDNFGSSKLQSASKQKFQLSGGKLQAQVEKQP